MIILNDHESGKINSNKTTILPSFASIHLEEPESSAPDYSGNPEHKDTKDHEHEDSICPDFEVLYYSPYKKPDSFSPIDFKNRNSIELNNAEASELDSCKHKDSYSPEFTDLNPDNFSAASVDSTPSKAPGFSGQDSERSSLKTEKSSLVSFLIALVLGGITGGIFSLIGFTVLGPSYPAIGFIDNKRIFSEQARRVASAKPQTPEHSVDALELILENYSKAVREVSKAHNVILLNQSAVATRVPDYTKHVEQKLFHKKQKASQ